MAQDNNSGWIAINHTLKQRNDGSDPSRGFALPFEDRQHVDTQIDETGVYTYVDGEYVFEEDNSLHGYFPMPGQDSADAMRKFLAESLAPDMITDMDDNVSDIEDVENDHLPLLQAKLWTPTTDTVLASSPEEKITVEDHIQNIASLLVSKHVFIVHSSFTSPCAMSSYPAHSTSDQVEQPTVTIEPLIHWGTITPVLDFQIAHGRVLAFRRNGEKCADPLWSLEINRILKNIDEPSAYCSTCLDSLIDQCTEWRAISQQFGMNDRTLRISHASAVEDAESNDHDKELGDAPNINLTESRERACMNLSILPTHDIAIPQYDGTSDSRAEPGSGHDLASMIIGNHWHAINEFEIDVKSESTETSTSRDDASDTSSTMSSDTGNPCEVTKIMVRGIIERIFPESTLLTVQEVKDSEIQPELELENEFTTATNPQQFRQKRTDSLTIASKPSPKKRMFGREIVPNMLPSTVKPTAKLLATTPVRKDTKGKGKATIEELTTFLDKIKHPGKSKTSPQTPPPSFPPYFAKHSLKPPTSIPDTVDEETYLAHHTRCPAATDRICTCHQPSRTPAVRIAQCANAKCPISWFHYDCLEKGAKLSARFGTTVCRSCKNEVEFKELDKTGEWAGGKIAKEGDGEAMFSKEDIKAFWALPADLKSNVNPYGMADMQVVKAKPCEFEVMGKFVGACGEMETEVEEGEDQYEKDGGSMDWEV